LCFVWIYFRNAIYSFVFLPAVANTVADIVVVNVLEAVVAVVVVVGGAGVVVVVFPAEPRSLESQRG